MADSANDVIYPVDLGIVTAYGEAVSAGYKGTYDEWCKLLANFGARADEVKTNAAAVENNTTLTKQYKDAAETAAQNASGYAGEAEFRLAKNPATGHMALYHYEASTT